MDNVTFIENTNPLTNEVTEHAIIDRGNGEFTSMLKSIYEAQQVEHLTEIPTPNQLEELCQYNFQLRHVQATKTKVPTPNHILPTQFCPSRLNHSFPIRFGVVSAMVLA